MPFLRKRLANRICPICGYSLQEDIDKDLSNVAGHVGAAYAEALVTHFQTVHPDFWNWEQSKRRLGVSLGLATAIGTGISLFYVFVMLLHLPSTTGRALVSICLLAFLLPYGLITRRGAEHFRIEWQAQGKTATPTPTVDSVANMQTTTDDTAIVSLTNNLASQLGISGVTVTDVAWQTLIPQGRVSLRVPSDGAVFHDHTIYLAENMEGKLSADEWRPLIASALINYRGLRPRKIRLVLEMAIPAIAAYIAAWFIIPPLFPTTTTCANGQCAWANTGVFILIFGGPALLTVMVIAGAIALNRFKLVADMDIMAAFGKGQLMTSLQRVIEVSPSEAYSVQKRINALNKSDLAGG